MQQNEHMIQEFTGEEVKEAVFAMHPDKSPRPDGMNPTFYQRLWKIIGKDVIDMCLHILSSGCMPQKLNDTLVVLTPKKNVPEVIGDLRPISVCNVLIKIVTKMLANMMKTILPSITLETQSAFISGRIITDNVVAAFEVNHWMHKKTQGKMGFSALKIDMSKAYDRVERNFLRSMLRKMGFANKWIDWIHLCVSMIKYSFLLSVKKIGLIIPSRGLRKRDPISPYLFLICEEGLSAIIRRREEEGSLHGCQISRSSPSVSHLFFADDSYMFFRATPNEARCIKDCLLTYERATGQHVNFQKSCIHFSSNTSADMAEVVSQILQVQITSSSSNYLGLPSYVGRNKEEVFRYVK